MLQNSLPIGRLGAYAKAIYPSDFTFIIGKHKYRCSRLLAAFLSPKIAQVIMADVLADSYTLPIDDSKFQFKQIFRLLQGETLEVTEDNRDYLARVGELLGNQEIIDQVREAVPEQTDALSVIQSARNLLRQGLKPDSEFEYISSHLSDFAPIDFIEFELDDLYMIFFSEHVRVDDESSLFRLVLSVIKQQQDPRARILLYSIACENLTMAEMVAFADEISHCEVTGSIFHGLCKRLLTVVNRRKYPVRRISGEHEFSYADGKPFEGFFSRIRQQWPDEAGGEGIVEITTSDGTSPVRITDPNWHDCWYSKNRPNSWIQFDFMEHAFQLRHYTLKTFIGGSGSGHLKNWVVEGSNNLNVWDQIDRRDDNADLNDRERCHTFGCGAAGGLYRYIRLRQFGKNHGGSDFLFLGNIEIFGALY
jgi:hypothetical protein